MRSCGTFSVSRIFAIFAIFLCVTLSLPELLLSQTRKATLLINQIDAEASGQVRIYLSIIAPDREPVLGLSQEAFNLFEDQHPVHSFKAARLDPQEATNVLLILDTSGSMLQEAKIDQVKEAAFRFLDTLSPNDQCSVIAFDDEIRVIRDFSNNVQDLKQSISELNAQNDTRLFDSIFAGIEHLSRYPSGRRALIVLTDGKDEGSIYMQDDCIHKALEENIPIYAVTVGTQQAIMRQAVARIALLSGGEYFHANAPSVLTDLYIKIANRLKKQYVIQFTSNLPADGAWHRLRVQLDNNEYFGFAAREFRRPGSLQPLNWFQIVLIVVLTLLALLLLIGSIVYYLLRRNDKVAERFTQQIVGTIPTPAPALDNPALIQEPEAPTDPVSSHRSGHDTMVIQGRQPAKPQPEQKALAFLVFIEGTKAGAKLAVRKKECSIGSSVDNDLQISDAGVAAFHAKIKKEKKQWIIYDLVSDTGTFVNDTKIERQELNDHDLIILGQAILEFRTR